MYPPALRFGSKDILDERVELDTALACVAAPEGLTIRYTPLDTRQRSDAPRATATVHRTVALCTQP
jgi:hypothetical protein